MQLRSLLEIIPNIESQQAVREIIETTLAYAEPIQNRPFHAARVALDTLVLYRQAQLIDNLPRWDIEVFREVAQVARWRQDADSHISQILGMVNKATQYLESSETT